MGGGITLDHFLVLSLIIFGLGLFTVLTRRNAIGILMGVELILNSANINYLAFSFYGGASLRRADFRDFRDHAGGGGGGDRVRGGAGDLPELQNDRCRRDRDPQRLGAFHAARASRSAEYRWSSASTLGFAI